MHNSRRALLRFTHVTLVAFGFSLSAHAQDKAVVRGWISDARCAPGHVSAGKYTGTNPDCSKECIAKGIKMLLIDPDHKSLLTVLNPAAAKNYVGDFVEISGGTNLEKKTVRIESVKLLEKGRAMCDVPDKSTK
jgi:hypothetical protein